MKTIRGKLFIYFFVFLLLLQITAISIYVSYKELTNEYDESFERFLLLNSISESAEALYVITNKYVVSPEDETIDLYFINKQALNDKKDALFDSFHYAEKIKVSNYINLIETFVHETELTIGFALKKDMEQYTNHVEEARISAGYIQEATLELIDTELTSYQAFYKDLQIRSDYFLMFIIFLFLTTMFLAVFFALWFSKGITRPLTALSEASKEVSDGNFIGEPVAIQSSDELAVLGEAFNHMRDNIHGLVEEIKDQSELDSLLKEMELKHLQNQINPHFLFNTLNTISKMAYLEDAQMTSKLIHSAAALLRHSLGSLHDNVTLQDELHVVEAYFRIQKTRFSERVEFLTEVDEACLGIVIPRLTLQPLVENAFIHGIEEKEEGGTIKITIKQDEKSVIIEVRDDGEGMEEERIDQLLHYPNEQEASAGHSTGIGLMNVIRRIQLFYRATDVVEIESEKGAWTTIRLLIPKHNGGWTNEDFNR